MQPAVEHQQLAAGGEVVDADLLHREADPPAHLASAARRRRGRRRVARPPVGRTSVPSMPIVVDLPAPFGPEDAEHLAGRTRNEIPRTASVPFG